MKRFRITLFSFLISQQSASYLVVQHMNLLMQKKSHMFKNQLSKIAEKATILGAHEQILCVCILS